jgi:hypothetical protein
LSVVACFVWVDSEGAAAAAAELADDADESGAVAVGLCSYTRFVGDFSVAVAVGSVLSPVEVVAKGRNPPEDSASSSSSSSV